MRNGNHKAESRTAVLWDESFLWGVMAYHALTENAIAFDLVRSGHIRNGGLRNYDLLFVPGGWASNKIKALGDEGVEEIRHFVRDGGSYLGFCGGAGLATSDGIGLLPVGRKPTRERVPSFSGKIRLDVERHPVWSGLNEQPGPGTPDSGPVFHAWWPSQFVPGEIVSVLARYGAAMPDAFSSDINIGDAEAHGGWTDLERRYGINLDPKRLLGEPAIVEGRYGKGRVVLSLVHFDTPADRNGALVLKNLWGYLAGGKSTQEAAAGSSGRERSLSRNPGAGSPEAASETTALEQTVSELIEFGRRNFLWYWRNPMLLQWRRGVRGLEYCTLFVLMKEIGNLVRHDDVPAAACAGPGLAKIDALLGPFAEKARHLLLRERIAMQHSPISYEHCDDPEIQKLREELFSRSKSYGGRFKQLVDEMDDLLYRLLNGTLDQ